jgi:hypothetical protein
VATATQPAKTTAKAKGSSPVTVPYAHPANEVQWADDFLTYIHAPTDKPELTFIVAAEDYEGTFHSSPGFIPRKYGDDNANNPLDSTQFEAGGVVWAENGGDPVWQFRTLKAGLESNAAVIEDNPGDAELLKDLRAGNKTAQELADDIAASDWGTGGGPGSAAEEGYSRDISDELQTALEQVNAPQAKSDPLNIPGDVESWLNDLGVGGLVNPPATIAGAGSAAKQAVESQFTKDLKAAWPYVLEGLGVLVGLGLVALGAWKATGREAPGPGTLLQASPQLAKAAAA